MSKVTGRKREVLVRLLEAKEDWVGGPELATVSCGGSEGLRRLRELRSEYGLHIEKERLEGHNYFSYRLLNGTYQFHPIPGNVLVKAVDLL
jgi:hypothetical protein